MVEFSIITENVSEAIWLNTKNIAVGRGSQTLDTPDLFVFIEKDSAPYLRVDLYSKSEESKCFQETVIWKSWAVIGYGNNVHLISTNEDTLTSIELDDYFGHLYPYDDFLLAASGSSLYKIDAGSNIIWKSANLGIDGVLVQNISDDVILGQGEWDPPGGWQSFQINCSTGFEIK